ncbi:response regulator transcription factor [Microbispora siamensis]
MAPAITRLLIERFTPHFPRPDLRAGDGGHAALTGRELEILREVARGRSNREIAGRLHLSESTVKVHVGRILAKLRLRDRAQLIVHAYEHGIVRPGDHT